jgi:hypothetical protein
MRTLWATNDGTIRAHQERPGQVGRSDPEAGMPPYLESFLAHLRMLVGVPFRYLVPDERLLPTESIRFFYLDRSWTDRLVDGAMAVGKIGTRELALHQSHAAPIQQQLDVAQRVVRTLQRRQRPAQPGRLGEDVPPYKKIVEDRKARGVEEGPITGLLLRSQLVSGWPHMDVRGYSWAPGVASPPVNFDPASLPAGVTQLEPLRIERLSPSVMIVLFDGEPTLVTLEEPHHGVQFGVRSDGGRLRIYARKGDGTLVDGADPSTAADVPFRRGGRRVVDVLALRDRLHALNQSNIPQRGSANFALSVLSPPYRQRFEGTEDERDRLTPPSVEPYAVADWVTVAPLVGKIQGVLTDGD